MERIVTHQNSLAVGNVEFLFLSSEEQITPTSVEDDLVDPDLVLNLMITARNEPQRRSDIFFLSLVTRQLM